MDSLIALTLHQASEAIRTKRISAGELTDAYLARIEMLDPRLNAFITVIADQARADARRLDEELGRGNYRGPLHGIPIAVKDLFDTRGIKTTAGSKILRDRVPDRDAFVIERLYEAGVVLLGKLNMHEFAYGVTNENSHYGNAHNPWNLDHITGGSSGGSGAAIAGRLALGALGSDTGGSIRIPSALCGVTGLKPTYGRVSLRGVIPLSWSNDHAGPMARNASDCAYLFETIAGYDRDDPSCVNVESEDPTMLSEDLRGVRIAVLRGYFEDKVDEEILRAVNTAADQLRTAGATVVERELDDAGEFFAINRVILRVEAAAYHREWLQTRTDEYGKDVLARLNNAASIKAEDYALAKRKQVELRRKLENFLDDLDALVVPGTRIAAPKIGSLDPVMLAEHLTAFTGPFNVTGVPALALPCGFTRTGLPIGMQIVGRPWDERMILQIGRIYQNQTDWHTRTPSL